MQGENKTFPRETERNTQVYEQRERKEEMDTGRTEGRRTYIYKNI